ncbi:MAG: lipopolysaccharide heptosyltransferase II [Elusimicrobiota bacterium]
MSPKILVIRLSSLGDVVLSGPVYTSLKTRWPDAHVAVLVKPQFAAALHGHPEVDEIVPFRGVLDAARLIRRGGYTHVLDLHDNLRSLLIRSLARVPNTVVYRKDALARRLFVSWRRPSASLQRHTVDRYYEALARWGITARCVKKALVLQSAFLGDSLLTLPLLRRLKEILPQAHVSVLTLAKTAGIFQGSSWCDAVIIDDKRGKHGGLLGPWRIARELARNEFDLAVIPHRSFRSALIAALAGVPRRIGFASSAGKLFLTETVPFSWAMHDLERNVSLAQALGAATISPAPRYIVPPALSERLSGLLATAAAQAQGRLVGVHPGSAWNTKRWLPERFGELCRRLKADGMRPVLVGGPDDAVLGAQIARHCEGAVDLCGQTSLEELKALMGRLCLFVTNDSGPMHLAAAAGVPVVAVFGATTKELGFFPYGAGHRVVETQLECRPCGLHGARSCPRGHFLCMRSITVDRVLNACRDAVKDSTRAGGCDASIA